MSLEEEMAKIIDRSKFKITKDAKEWLINMANGDARQMITMLDNTSPVL
jgi:replication-associated recombination protein RarA